MIGWSDKHDGVATFRIDRIKGCPDVLDEPAHKMPKGFKLDKFMNTTFRMFNSETEKVTLECAADTYDSVVDRFGTGINAVFIGDKYKASVTVAVNHLFYSWIFGFGGKVRIIEPEYVKAGYIDMVNEAYELSRQ